MELMLIVWLVSILSSIKAFVSSYITFIVLVSVAVYLGLKVNHRYVIRSLQGNKYKDGTVVIANRLIVGHHVIPEGSYVDLDVYDNYCYVSYSAAGISRARVDRYVMEVALTPTTPPTETEVVMPLLTGVIPNRIAILCYTLIGLQVLLPSDNTIKYMAGAYLIQSTYDSEFVQTALPLGQKAVINQLERWSKDSEELKDLLIEGTTTK